MKLGIFLLVLGLLIAAVGVYAWQNYSPSLYSYRPEDAQQLYSAGIAGIALGGGLFIGGVIRMILKRK